MSWKLRNWALITATLVSALGGSRTTPEAEPPLDLLLADGSALVVNLEPQAYSDCPADWVCLWEDPNFGGQSAFFRDCCSWYNLADVGFNNRMSSWRNRKSVDAKVADFADGNGDRLCLGNNSSDSALGPAWDNQATSVKLFSGSGAC